ncbi:helix-turn-helix domain-containing protein [Acidisoma silvae]|uniref:Helix-turn-helix domain-containing protein n=1 Tax=Acidisoma silvae TaxID=2802396 RepID=A0A964DY32_9PROT|nr:AraC family transcriptional regulator [Acidisoma silvae]MCB8874499.1 helix-turn-helix domain-containing protein [Acidisoma silvae]
MKPIFEKVTPDEGASWALLDRRMPERIPFEWHHHPEYELTLTLNSRGHRYIGSDVDAYDDGDLVFIGPGIPHSWCSEAAVDPARPHIALVIWFSHAWADSLLALFPEMARLRPLLAASAQGVCFSHATRAAVRPRIEAMSALDPAARLVSLLEVLLAVSADRDATTFTNAPGAAGLTVETDPRIMRVLDHLHRHFAEPVTIPMLADIAHVSVSAFHRMFRRHTRMTAVDYITRLRIGRACSFLIAGDMAVARIADDVGFQNLSLFNRQFAALKGQTPTAFRHRQRATIYPAQSGSRQNSIRRRA